MGSLSTWIRYAATKFEHSIKISWESYNAGHLNAKEFHDCVWKNFFHSRLTFLHMNKGKEMEPTIAGHRGNVLVRKLPVAEPKQVFVGDVVLLLDPEKQDDFIIRRLAAKEGYEMISKDEKDTPFVLEKNQCWITSDNENMKPKEARDSRLFGPVPMTNIIGRVIYSLRSAVDHGPVQNSDYAMAQDTSVLAVELDVDEMSRNTKT